VLTIDYDRLDVRAGMRVLDLGCGGGRHSFEPYRRGAEVIAVDWGVEEVSTTRRWLGAIRQAGQSPPGTLGTAVRADLRALPFPDAYFDRVIASEVLEHIHDDVTAMAELSRVLRPGGRAVVTVPRFWPERVCWALSTEYHDVEGGHVRIYRGHELVGRLGGAGLVHTGTAHAHALHSPYWWLKCALGSDRDPAVVRAYHKVLVWDIMRKPWLTQTAERLLNPVLGKSLVVYLRKPAGEPETTVDLTSAGSAGGAGATA
jgi:SAM-dependent methyltransferase